MNIYVMNETDGPVYFAAHHEGCAGTPWRKAKPKCHDEVIGPGFLRQLFAERLGDSLRPMDGNNWEQGLVSASRSY